MNTERTLIFGGRYFSDALLFARVMQDFPLPRCIIQGEAKGADKMARAWAEAKGLPCLCVPANWAYYDKSAGMLRNRWMLELCAPTYAIGFPGGAGTQGMITLLVKAGVPHYAVKREHWL